MILFDKCDREKSSVALCRRLNGEKEKANRLFGYCRQDGLLPRCCICSEIGRKSRMGCNGISAKNIMNKKAEQSRLCSALASPRGFEPPTPRLGGVCSIQLSYEDMGNECIAVWAKKDITMAGCAATDMLYSTPAGRFRQ